MRDEWGSMSRVINDRMVELGMSQHDLVVRSGLSRGTVHELRNGGSRGRTVQVVRAMSDALGLSEDDLKGVRPQVASAEGIRDQIAHVLSILCDIEIRLVALERGIALESCDSMRLGPVQALGDGSAQIG
ncbi:helix-turn-helix domain-containing protein [Actinokineospora globicatena]|uniref:HTH cro/C1-type domain-containing protein n=1 Tax=Actinokineospora globicatena TaxID=103729 RepID=A0A9W6QPJ8_9PSEU|nr:helix-turn-helix transcriptional regulator [Actinokineospora globicatena]GLW92317.1 hypothetical protein Aglo03_31330 [Actinokineospora globicatena]